MQIPPLDLHQEDRVSRLSVQNSPKVLSSLVPIHHDKQLVPHIATAVGRQTVQTVQQTVDGWCTAPLGQHWPAFAKISQC